MAPNIIVSYDDTDNDRDALALGRLLAVGGAELSLAYVRHVHTSDPAREALASSLVGFAEGVGAQIVAEGISSDEDLALLRSLCVDYGQGYHLARPSALLN